MQANTKEWIQYSTAIAMVASAIVLAFLSFFITSTIASGVLWYISEALVYAGSVFGISIYFKTKLGDFESKTRERMKRELEYVAEKLAEKVENKD
jgi:prepilin signal peptidase PulO-like enzyme (type II secretory pathway)